MELDPDAVPGRYSRKLVVHEEPAVAAHLARIAAEVGVSTASLVRAAVRDWLRRVDPQGRVR